MKSLRDSHTEATVEALLRAGRDHFGRHGFDAASLEAIAAEARVTTGAIYHHFSGKKGLFLAVAEGIERGLLAVAAGVQDGDPWVRTHTAFGALIKACSAPVAPVLLSILAETSRAVSVNPALTEDAHDLMSRMLDALRLGEEIKQK